MNDAHLSPQIASDDAPVDLRCSVVVLRGTDVLLLHRGQNPRDDQDGDWVLPGGRPRPNEGLAACARREAAEETGLDVVVQRCLFVLEVTPPHDGGRIVEILFLAHAPADREPDSPEPRRQARFVPLADTPRLRLLPPLAGYLRGLRLGATSGAPYLGNLWRPDEHAPEPEP